MKETPSSTAPATTGEASTTSGSGCSFHLHNIQTAEALARFAGDEGRLRHWLLDFRAYGTQAATDIEQALARGDVATATTSAHALKGRTGMLGMTELHSIAQSLELTLKNGEPSRFWLDELARTLAETQAEIGAVLAND